MRMELWLLLIFVIDRIIPPSLGQHVGASVGMVDESILKMPQLKKGVDEQKLMIIITAWE